MFLIALAALGVFLIDQGTKWLALKLLVLETNNPVIPGVFHLSLVRNTGIAFGLFRGHGTLLTIFVTAGMLALGIGAYLFRKQTLGKRIIYGLIWGGALGNWLDRIRFHHVVDFLDFRIWPVFNFADSFITCGVVLLMYFVIRGK